MADLLTITIIMLVSGLWGAIGGFIWWALPTRPSGWIKFVQRVGVGWTAGAIWNALGGISPFDAVGNWDSGGIMKLITAGFMGLASVASFFPEQLYEDWSKRKKDNRGDSD